MHAHQSRVREELPFDDLILYSIPLAVVPWYACDLGLLGEANSLPFNY